MIGSTRTKGRRRSAAKGAPSPVVIGIIDDGIAFAHERFRSGGNTRVEYWWLQDGPWQGLGTIWPGCELDKVQINLLLAGATNAGMIDEDEVYRQAHLTDFQRPGHKSAAWRIAHGTHVMDLACGYDSQLGRDDRPIVAVQLPIRVTADTSGATLFPFVHHAMQYILRRADDIARSRGLKSLPVVINLSYGYFAGPHDGTSHFERAMDHLVKQSKKKGVELRIVIPAGNSYILRTHARVEFPTTASSATLDWRIQPNGLKPSYLEIWLPPSAGLPPARVALTVTPPAGPPQTILEYALLPTLFGPVGGQYCQIIYHYHNLTGRGLFLIFVKETDSLIPGTALAPSGTWKVELHNQALGLREVIRAWVQRDDSLYGFPVRGRQSYFANGSYTRFDGEGRDQQKDDPACVVRRAETLNAIATGDRPIVIGGFLRKEMQVAEYSSAGPVANPPRPDAVAVTEDSLVHYGLLAAGSRSGSVVAMNGTSVAAPQIARAIADDLAIGGNGDRTTVPGLVNCHPTSPAPPPMADRSGAGGINLPPLVALQRYWA
jgi:Subtilase family